MSKHDLLLKNNPVSGSFYFCRTCRLVTHDPFPREDCVPPGCENCAKATAERDAAIERAKLADAAIYDAMGKGWTLASAAKDAENRRLMEVVEAARLVAENGIPSDTFALRTALANLEEK